MINKKKKKKNLKSSALMKSSALLKLKISVLQKALGEWKDRPKHWEKYLQNTYLKRS